MHTQKASTRPAPSTELNFLLWVHFLAELLWIREPISSTQFTFQLITSALFKTFSDLQAPGRPQSTMHVCVCVCVLTHFSRVQLFATPGTVAHKAPLFVGFSRQKYWSGLPCSRPVDLSDPGIEPSSALAGRLFTTNATWEATEHSGQGQNQSQTPVLGLDPSPIPYKPRQFKILPN